MNLRIQKSTILSRALHKAAVIGFSAAMALSTLAISARADDLVINGSFEVTNSCNTSLGADSCVGSNGQLGYNIIATGWTTTGYNFIFASGTADNGGANGQYGALQLWGPNDGSSNGLPASSPDGGNFVGADGAYDVGAIQQTINGLTAGNSYTVGFWWAGAQQYNYTGINTEQFQVSLGSQTQSTAVLTNASQGFTGWQYQTFTFIADNTSDVLSFLAVGTPSGQPPFSLLDGVTLYASVPEPSSWILVLSVLGLAGGLRCFRSKKLAKS
jgi:hypothetical protein